MQTEHNSADPVGVFDSGVGGLAILREIRHELPGEDLLYVADSGHAPYGDKSTALIEERSLAIAEFLVSQHAKALVVACNTATGVAIKALRARFQVPIVAMEPAVKPAAAHTRSGVIGVLATSRTIASDNFARLHERFGSEVKILMQACPGLVEQVEAGNLSGDRTRALVEQYVPASGGAACRHSRAGLHALPVPRPADPGDSRNRRRDHRSLPRYRPRAAPAIDRHQPAVGRNPARQCPVLEQRQVGIDPHGDFPIMGSGYRAAAVARYLGISPTLAWSLHFEPSPATGHPEAVFAPGTVSIPE